MLINISSNSSSTYSVKFLEHKYEFISNCTALVIYARTSFEMTLLDSFFSFFNFLQYFFIRKCRKCANSSYTITNITSIQFYNREEGMLK